jgi:hypothetical protein
MVNKDIGNTTLIQCHKADRIPKANSKCGKGKIENKRICQREKKPDIKKIA